MVEALEKVRVEVQFPTPFLVKEESELSKGLLAD